MRSAILVWRKLLNRPVSALPAAFAALFPSDGRRCGSPLGNFSLLPVGLGSLDTIHGIASETLTRAEPAGNTGGAFELAHLYQVAASSALLLADLLSTGTAASEGARVLRKAGAKPVWVRSVARELKNHAIDFEAEPEEEFRVQAQ